MHRSKLFTASLVCTAMAGWVSAQQSGTHDPSLPSVTQGLSDEIAPGERPGTQRWNVVFNERSFDLAEFSEAVRSNASVDRVDAIVADLQRRAIEDQRRFTEDVEALGGRVLIHFWLINAASVEILPQHVDTLRTLPNVHSVRPDLITYPLAPIKTATNSSHHNADAEQANGNVATGYAVAIVDTGQDRNYAGGANPHAVYYKNGDKTDHSGAGFDGSRLRTNQALGAQPADDTHGHGTGVSGIAAGGGWNTGNADQGHASDADICGYSICQFAGSCGSTLAIEAAGWQAAAADKVRFNIVSANMSYGSSPNPADVSQMAIDAAALNADIVPCCSAGNSSSSTAGSAAVANGLAVAACDNNKVMASFSSRGPISGDTQRFYPDITANGVSTVMPLNNNENSDWVASGTSMASPQVCGAAALVKSARPCLSARDIKAVLLAATESIAAQNPSAPYNNRNSYGMGYLRDDLACNTARTPGSVVTDSISSTAAPNVHTITVAQGQRVRIALVWFRHVLTSTAWSNLGLTVKNGGATVASNDDPRNLYEVVEFTAPITGNLTVEVKANSLEIADVPYTLAFVNATSGNTATFTTFGGGCQGSNGNTPVLSFTGVPRLGESYDVDLNGGPNSGSGVLFIGFSDTIWGGAAILPFDLSIIGGLGCTVYASDEIVLNVNTDGSGQATRTLPTPCDTGFIGLEVFYQFILQDGVNPLGLISSNAGQGDVGW